ncbi:uncharacterized protein ASPGLDRAFT_953925 [Aspergillus glaucus CBS 516.65]|uniref:Uncharacterized protein n=1 Tax=Aspergillus glaucus CBS 516.65 TaxID=1160497 RepID=A0A1L9V6W4_ASPGL|nr:hypothetical protein ASPGLDRAFT_953925 [Aspergillus glaucus CBS 516.65]OJJ79655.1 hypothetical protein ASPGLDRAFT_953925 [Aspergillus glaucus CBS 516.65]
MIVTCPRTIYICIFNMITIAAQPNSRIFRYYLHFFQQTTNPVPSFAPTESDHGALWYSPPMDLDTFLTGGQADKTTKEVRLPLFLVYIYKNNFSLVSHLKRFLYKKLRRIISKDLICPESCKGTPYAAQLSHCHVTERKNGPLVSLTGFERKPVLEYFHINILVDI